METQIQIYALCVILVVVYVPMQEMHHVQNVKLTVILSNIILFLEQQNVQTHVP